MEGKHWKFKDGAKDLVTRGKKGLLVPEQRIRGMQKFKTLSVDTYHERMYYRVAVGIV